MDYIKITENIGHISHFLINLSIDRNNDIVPLFNFHNEDKLEICALNNKFTLFLNKESCECFNIKNRIDLQNKEVVYLIYTKDGCYIGQTSDFGERMHTHIKDVPVTDRDLYDSIKRNKVCYVSILHVIDDNTGLGRGIEHEYLKSLLSWKNNNHSFTSYIFNCKS